MRAPFQTISARPATVRRMGTPRAGALSVVLSDGAIDSHGHLTGPGAINAPLDTDRVGSFAIVRLIGRGGMGEVYEATQASPQRRVALKVIRAGATSRASLARFRREGEVLGLLHHPGIAQIFESGTHEGRPYIAMEYVEGPDLKTYAERQNLGTRVRLELVARVADAIHHAHQKGIVHRDLKPENVHVPPPVSSATQTGTAAEFASLGQPKVLDFGIARAAEGLVGVTGGQTIAGQLVGTLAYMSPEQIEGDDDIDVRADVFALGTIAYELLSGSLPT